MVKDSPGNYVSYYDRCREYLEAPAEKTQDVYDEVKSFNWKLSRSLRCLRGVRKELRPHHHSRRHIEVYVLVTISLFGIYRRDRCL